MWQEQRRWQERKTLSLHGKQGKQLTIKSKRSRVFNAFSKSILKDPLSLQSVASRKIKVIYQQGEQRRGGKAVSLGAVTAASR